MLIDVKSLYDIYGGSSLPPVLIVATKEDFDHALRMLGELAACPCEMLEEQAERKASDLDRLDKGWTPLRRLVVICDERVDLFFQQCRRALITLRAFRSYNQSARSNAQVSPLITWFTDASSDSPWVADLNRVIMAAF